MQRLKEAAEKAKIELSSTTSTEINLPYITAEGGVPKHLVKTLTRSQFEQLAHELIQNCLVPCQNAIRDAKLSTSDIDEVILVGGSSRIPAVQTLVKNYFGKEPSKGVNPDEVVAVGAAIQGAILNKESGVGDIVLLDVTPLTLGHRDDGWCDDEAHRGQHNHSVQEERGLLYGCRQPDGGDHPRPAG